jgi:hypothetical protein
MACTLDDDLVEYGMRNIIAGVGVVDHEILLVLHQGAEVLDRHVAARSRVIEPSIGISLVDDRFRGHDDLGARLSRGQHSLFFLNAATVLSEAGRWQDRSVGLPSHTIDAGQPGDASN